MVDKVKFLKIENPSTGGTQTDPYPREGDPTQDYAAVAGIALQNSDTRLINLDGSGNIQFTDVTQTTAVTVTQLKTAVNNTFNNSTNGFIATNVQTAIEEARNSVLNYYDSGTAVIQTTSTGYTPTDLSIASVPTGTYFVSFSCIVSNSASNRTVSAAIYVGGVLTNTAAQRTSRIGSGGGLVGTLLNASSDTPCLAIGTIITLAAPTTVAVYWSTSASTGFMTQRELVLLRVA